MNLAKLVSKAFVQSRLSGQADGDPAEEVANSLGISLDEAERLVQLYHQANAHSSAVSVESRIADDLSMLDGAIVSKPDHYGGEIVGVCRPHNGLLKVVVEGGEDFYIRRGFSDKVVFVTATNDRVPVSVEF